MAKFYCVDTLTSHWFRSDGDDFLYTVHMDNCEPHTVLLTQDVARVLGFEFLRHADPSMLADMFRRPKLRSASAEVVAFRGPAVHVTALKEVGVKFDDVDTGAD